MPDSNKVPRAFGRIRFGASKLKRQSFIKRIPYMNKDIKQAMHVEAGKSFGTAETNENERRWNDDKIDRKNQEPTNHYDKTRMKLNFEIGPDGKVHPLGYQKKSLEVRLQERLTELGWSLSSRTAKFNQTVVRNLSSEAIMTVHLKMAFGTQTVNLDKDADNSHLQRCPEIEQWAKDVYDWCAKRYGQENIIGLPGFILMRAARISMP